MRNWRNERRETQNVLTPEKLIDILDGIYGGKIAEELYTRLTGDKPQRAGKEPDALSVQ